LHPSGIVDSHGYMLSLQGELEDHGGALALNSPVTGGDPRRRILVEVGGPIRSPCTGC
jgi:L-2-hydroxyglutarate oxidase LhgO